MPGLVSLFALGIVLSRYFAPGDYGVYQAATWLVSFLPPLLGLGIAKSVSYFLPRVDRPRAFLARVLVLGAAAGVACAALLPAMDRRGDLPLIVAAILVVGFSDRLLEPVMVALGRARRLAALQAAFGFLILVAILVPVLLDRPLADVLAGLLACCAIQAGVLLAVCARAPARAAGRAAPGFRELAAYGGPVGLGGALAQVAQNLDKVIAWFYVPLAGYAVYQRGAMEIPLFSSFAFLALSVITPELVRRHAAGDREGYGNLFRETTRLIALTTLPLFAFFLFTAGDFILLLYGEPYAGSAAVFRLYLCLLPLRVVWSQTLLETAGRARAVLACGALLLAVHLPLSFLLLTPERPWGPAASMVAANVAAWWLLGLPLARRALGVRLSDLLPWRDLLKVSVCSAVGVAVLVPLRLLDLPRPLWLTVAAAGYFAASGALLAISGAIRREDRAWLRGLLRRARPSDRPPSL